MKLILIIFLIPLFAVSQIKISGSNINTPTDINIMLDGDSQFTILNCTGCILPSIRLDTAYRYLTKNKVVSNAVSGQNTSQMLANIQTHLNANYDTSYKNNVCILWCGINDILEMDWDTDTTYTMLLGSINLANAKGFKTFVMTQNYVRLASESVYDQNRNIDSTTVLNNKIINGAIANNYTVLPNHLYCKWNTTTSMNNTLYFLDGVHRTDLGLFLLSDFIYNEINKYLQ